MPEDSLQYFRTGLMDELKKRTSDVSNRCSIYLDRNLWIRQPSRLLLLAGTRFPTPAQLLRPDILMIFPDALLSPGQILTCPKANCTSVKALTNNGESDQRNEQRRNAPLLTL